MFGIVPLNIYRFGLVGRAHGDWTLLVLVFAD